jgi:hypothetical protein
MLWLTLALAAPSLERSQTTIVSPVARTVERADVDGAPVRGASVVASGPRRFGRWPVLDGPASPAMGATKARDVAVARMGGRATAAPTLVWSTREGVARLAWSVTGVRAAATPTSWAVTVDATTGDVRTVALTSMTADALYYPTNPVNSTIDVTQVPFGLQSVWARVRSCRATDPDPSALTLASCELADRQAVADINGDYLFRPAVDAASDPFAEVHALAHVEHMSAWLDDRWGLRVAAAPIDVFVNFPLNNAFFGDFDGDGRPDISFGHATDAPVDLAYDADVVYHELGHAVVATLAPELPFLQADDLGMDWVSGSVNEGAADVFAMLLTGDPQIGEYAGLAFRDGPIRDVESTRRCPDDLRGEVHADGEVLGSFFWQLIEHPYVGPEVAGDLLVASIPLWGAEPSWALVGESLAVSADDLVAAGVLSSAGRIAVDGQLERSGLVDCERVVTLQPEREKSLLLLNVGLFGELERIPGNVQMRIPADASDPVLVIDDGATGDQVGWTLFVRRGAPVEHEVFAVDGLGLSVAVARAYDGLLDGDGRAEVALATLAEGADGEGDWFIALASRNQGVEPLNLVYGEATVRWSDEPSPAVDAAPAARAVVAEPAAWACQTGLGGWWVWGALALAARRRG